MLYAGRVYQEYKEMPMTHSGYKCYYGKYNIYFVYGYIHPKKCVWIVSNKQGGIAEDVLQKLAAEHKIVDDILGFRELTKLKSTLPSYEQREKLAEDVF